MIEGVKLLGDIFSDEIGQWNNDIQVVEDRLVVKFYEI